MTTVIIIKNSNKQYRGFICDGHAGYAKKKFFSRQPDILCSAISTLVINTINSLEAFTDELENMEIETDEKDGYINCQFKTPITDEKSILLLDAMTLGLKKLNEEYGNEYLQVKFEEV